VAAKGRSLWRDLNTSFLDGWAVPASHLFKVVSAAQKAQADSADEFVDLVLRGWGENISPAGEIIPGSLTGIASDGRGLASLLMQPVVSTKYALKNGATIDQAMARGQAHLDAILRTQVTDAGRVADNMAVTTRVDTKWVRVIYGETCDRCAVLAGNVYSWKADFLRHPLCDCYPIPITSRDDAKAAGVITSPRDYFDSLSRAEQDAVFTKDSAQAIRDGADIAQVVNARRGMSAAGKTTKEGTRHGFAKSRGVTAGRLMPEAIYELADGNQAEAIRLLRLNAYIA
jgi:hypothetical protein